eukprot:RCo027554
MRLLWLRFAGLVLVAALLLRTTAEANVLQGSSCMLEVNDCIKACLPLKGLCVPCDPEEGWTCTRSAASAAVVKAAAVPPVSGSSCMLEVNDCIKACLPLKGLCVPCDPEEGWTCTRSAASAAVVKAAAVPPVSGAASALPCIGIQSEWQCNFACQGAFKKNCVPCPSAENQGEAATYTCPVLDSCFEKTWQNACDSICKMFSSKPCGICKDDSNLISCTSLEQTPRLETP